MAKNEYFYALGRRKSATARVRLTGGNGTVTINGKPAADYFSGSQQLLWDIELPFRVLEKEKAFNVEAKVDGGGHSAQVDAIRLGISRALATFNEDFKGTLKKADLLGRDPREKERKKFGLRTARKQRQFTKR